MNKYIEQVGKEIATESGTTFCTYTVSKNCVTFICEKDGERIAYRESFEDIKNHYGLIV